MSASYLDPYGTDEYIRRMIAATAIPEPLGEDTIRLADHQALARRMDEESNPEKRAALAPLAALGERKTLVHAMPEHLAVIAELTAKMPNAAPFLERVKCRLRAQILGRRPVQLGNLLLVGNPGNGKTHACQTLGEALGLPVFPISLAGNADTLALFGSARQWGSAGAGRIVSALARSKVANPIFILDEIDKSAQFASHGAVQDALLDLLEPGNAVRFEDKFLALPVDLSHSSFLCTANDESAMSEPLRSRLEGMLIEPPHHEQWPALVDVLYAATLTEMGLQAAFMTRFPVWLLQDLLAGCDSIRSLKRRVRTSIETALMALDDDELAMAQNLVPCPVSAAPAVQEAPRRRMGFV